MGYKGSTYKGVASIDSDKERFVMDTEKQAAYQEYLESERRRYEDSASPPGRGPRRYFSNLGGAKTVFFSNTDDSADTGPWFDNEFMDPERTNNPFVAESERNRSEAEKRRNLKEQQLKEEYREAAMAKGRNGARWGDSTGKVGEDRTGGKEDDDDSPRRSGMGSSVSPSHKPSPATQVYVSRVRAGPRLLKTERF